MSGCIYFPGFCTTILLRSQTNYTFQQHPAAQQHNKRRTNQNDNLKQCIVTNLPRSARPSPPSPPPLPPPPSPAGPSPKPLEIPPLFAALVVTRKRLLRAPCRFSIPDPIENRDAFVRVSTQKARSPAVPAPSSYKTRCLGSTNCVVAECSARKISTKKV